AGSIAASTVQLASANAPAAPDPTRSASSGVSDVAPSGVIAMGHSGLTGEGTGALAEPVPSNSWATGDAPDVQSVYRRLREMRPDLGGQAENQAAGGASADELPAQTRAALLVVPHPALAIVQTIDSDIRCD